jgi:hypothetical protein
MAGKLFNFQTHQLTNTKEKNTHQKEFITLSTGLVEPIPHV